MRAFETFLNRRTQARWRKAAGKAGQTAPAHLQTRLQAARRLQRILNNFQLHADQRLAALRDDGPFAQAPPGADWAWRPAPWQTALRPPGIAPAPSGAGLGDDLRLFHDCPLGQVSLRQSSENGRLGVDLVVYGFAGSYLSLVIECPDAACAGLRKQHLVGLGGTITSERPCDIQARLNLRNGPNVEQILQPWPKGDKGFVGFDLAYSGLQQGRGSALWIDLLIGAPGMNRITIRDLTLYRYPRADM